jgi:hypothetical protein
MACFDSSIDSPCPLDRQCEGPAVQKAVLLSPTAISFGGSFDVSNVNWFDVEKAKDLAALVWTGLFVVCTIY